MLLQAYDFVHLHRTHRCRLQVGGSDQFGNITAGCELMRRLEGPQLFGLVAPLLLDSTGEKMGKTSTGERIWLDPERTIPYEFYQYWFNRSDDEVSRFLRYFSLRPIAEIEEVLRDHDRDRAKRTGQRELARAMTAWVHGEAAIANVERAQRVMFGESLEGMSDADLRVLVGIVKTVDIPRGELTAGIAVVDLLVRTLADSKGAARRLITQGGAYLNNVKVTDVDHKVTAKDLATHSMLVVGSGTKKKCLVRVV
jgi:tyrosyl-tRNA synthetase